MFKTRMILIASLALAAAACGDDGDGMMTGEAELTLSFTNVPELGADYVYEGWLITPAGPVSSGRFTVDASGALSPASFMVGHETADTATAFVLTIEPATGDDPAPADSHLLAGPITGGSASLTTSDAAALGTDFASAAGDYILATPTTMADDTDDSQGIWWLVPGDTPAASLTLPTLPAGWVYEGWVVGDDGPVSTGTFAAADVADSDGAGATAGTDGAPPFPGQDFITPAMDLVGGAAVISVEPVPDDNAAPFVIKPLVDADIEDIAAPTSQPMTNNAAASLPAGSATLTSHE